MKQEEIINMMYEALLKWLEENETYDNFEGMIESAEEYIDNFLIETNYVSKLCDKGLITVPMFTSYIFLGEPWDGSSIFYTLVEDVIDVESLKDAKRAAACFRELLQLKKALRNVEVKIVPED